MAEPCAVHDQRSEGPARVGRTDYGHFPGQWDGRGGVTPDTVHA
ncbi:hypothetical protein AB0F96_23870 [Streptomyces sp. NPDC023998]